MTGTQEDAEVRAFADAAEFTVSLGVGTACARLEEGWMVPP